MFNLTTHLLCTIFCFLLFSCTLRLHGMTTPVSFVSAASNTGLNIQVHFFSHSHQACLLSFLYMHICSTHHEVYIPINPQNRRIRVVNLTKLKKIHTSFRIISAYTAILSASTVTPGLSRTTLTRLGAYGNGSFPFHPSF